MIVVEIKVNITMDKEFKKSQIALIMTICDYILTENSNFTSGQLRVMLQDAIDLLQEEPIE